MKFGTDRYLHISDIQYIKSLASAPVQIRGVRAGLHSTCKIHSYGKPLVTSRSTAVSRVHVSGYGHGYGGANPELSYFKIDLF